MEETSTSKCGHPSHRVNMSIDYSYIFDRQSSLKSNHLLCRTLAIKSLLQDEILVSSYVHAYSLYIYLLCIIYLSISRIAGTVHCNCIPEGFRKSNAFHGPFHYIVLMCAGKSLCLYNPKSRYALTPFTAFTIIYLRTCQTNV